MIRQDTKHWQAGWKEHEDAEIEAWMSATPAQRLAWLEEALVLAYKAGSLPLVKEQ